MPAEQPLRRPVRVTQRAIDQLGSLSQHIEAEAGRQRAIGYLSGFTNSRRSLGVLPERGALRNDLAPGLRLIGWGRRAVVAIIIAADEEIVLGVCHAGQRINVERG